jgi:hypothetical protein
MAQELRSGFLLCHDKMFMTSHSAEFAGVCATWNPSPFYAEVFKSRLAAVRVRNKLRKFAPSSPKLEIIEFRREQ